MTEHHLIIRVWLKFVALVVAVVLFSFLASSLWQGKVKEKQGAAPLLFRDGMTIAEFGKENGLPSDILKKVFQLQNKEDQQQTLESLNIAREEVASMVNKEQTIEAEYESRDWVKIPLKFALWGLFLGGVFVLMRRRKITPSLRIVIYLAAAVLFGVILGSDPGPMGTIKDTIVLFAAKGMIFPPRIIALAVFLLLVFLANKFICSWGCQVGALQDIVFRLNRDRGDKKGIMRQYRLPFRWSNAIRILFLLIFTLAAFVWGFDLIEPVDPFKIYKPAVVGLTGGVFIGLILVFSLFVYRPWCHLFCPFGLFGWLIEKISLYRIIVDHQTCIDCGSCEKACPSTAMEAILKRDRVIPDCFSCGSCIGVCPTGSIQLATGKRGLPPEGRFIQKTPE